MIFEVKIIGIDRVKVVLDRIRDGLDPNVQEALDKVADKVKEDAKNLCPVDTGSLQKSIRKEAVARPAGTKWEIGVRAGGYVMNPKSHRIVDYATYIEYGWSRKAPEGFLRPALYRNRQALTDAMQLAVKDAIREAGA